MDLYILNSSYRQVAVIDSYTSLIWTKRYYTCGDFELYMPANKNLLQYLQSDYFIIREDDDSVMIIEKLEIQTNVENGDYFIISGKSLESILARRVIFPQVNINTRVPIAGIKALINFCVSPSVVSDMRRAIPNLIYGSSVSASGELKAQFTGDNLLTAVTSICTRFGIGIKMTLQNSNFVLSFYKGNVVNTVFSPEFDNLITSKYIFDYTNYATYARVAGEGEGALRKAIGIDSTERVGISRREIFVDARDISSNNGEISNEEYIEILQERGLEKLDEHSATKSFEAEIEPKITFQYKQDYDLGDIVEFKNEYGAISHPRIIEIIESWNETGYNVIPTFEELEVE